MDRKLLWSVQSHGQWRAIGTELSPKQTQRIATPSFANKWRLQCNHWRKRSQLELTTSQRSWPRRVERIWPSPLTQPLVIILPMKGNLQQCQNYRTISLISHPSKVMLKIVLNSLEPQAEKIIAEEQAGFRAGRSTTEQILDLWVLCEKYLQHQQDIYHFFIDFKKAFDSVWHTALWAIMKKYNISTNLIRVIKTLWQGH